MSGFACPPDCGYCCTHLRRDEAPEQRVARLEFQALLRDEGVYHCLDEARVGLSLSNEEAAALRAQADARGLRAKLHPRTYLLDARRRLAVTLDWHLAHEACPFYAGFRCTAYAQRPLVCRAYPVLVADPRRVLAPECPKMPVAGAALRVELRARRSIEERLAALDARALDALAGGRFSRGLPARDAAERLRRYRVVPLEEWLRAAPARSSTS